jgi:hypothetical protein
MLKTTLALGMTLLAGGKPVLMWDKVIAAPFTVAK